MDKMIDNNANRKTIHYRGQYETWTVLRMTAMKSSDELTENLDVDMDRHSFQGAQLIIYLSRSLRAKTDTFRLEVPLTTRKGIFEYVCRSAPRRK